MARLHGLRTFDEYLAANSGARRGGELAGVRIDVGSHDAFGRLEGFYVAIFAMLMRALHELGPDGQRALRSFELEVAIIVEAYPDDANDLGREAGKPSVARRAGFT